MLLRRAGGGLRRKQGGRRSEGEVCVYGSESIV